MPRRRTASWSVWISGLSRLRRDVLSVIHNRPIRNRSMRRVSHVPCCHEIIRQLTNHGMIALYSNIDYELIDYE